MKKKKIPMRQCVGCRESRPKGELIRILKTPEDDIVLDTTGRQNGRGAYICPSSECYKKAVKTKALERSLGISISADIYEDIERQMLVIDKE